MSEHPKSTILDKYHRAISALPLDEQFERAQKIKGKTLRRMLSDKAPDQLVARFNSRFQEVVGLGLSSYEQGRVLVAQEKLKEAAKKYDAAVKGKDKRGHLGLAQIASAQNTTEGDSHAIKHYQAAHQAGAGNSYSHFSLGVVHYKNEQDEQADPEFAKAIEMDSNDDVKNCYTDYVKGMNQLVQGNTKDGMKAMESAAQKGLVDALSFVMNIASKHQNMTMLKKYGDIAATFGHTRSMLKVGEILEKNGEVADAEIYYRKALKAGYTTEASTKLAGLLRAEKKYDEALTFCDQLITEGSNDGHYGKIAILFEQGKNDEAAEHLINAQKQGAKIPVFIAATALSMVKKYDEALKLCKANVAREPKLNLVLGIIYGELGNREAQDFHMQLGLKKAGLAHKVQEAKELAQSGDIVGAKNLIADTMARAIAEVGIPDEMLDAMIKQKRAKSAN